MEYFGSMSMVYMITEIVYYSFMMITYKGEWSSHSPNYIRLIDNINA